MPVRSNFNGLKIPLYIDAGLLIIGLIYGVLMWGRVEELMQARDVVSIDRIARTETQVGINTLRLNALELHEDLWFRTSEARREIAILEARLDKLEARQAVLEREVREK